MCLGYWGGGRGALSHRTSSTGTILPNGSASTRDLLHYHHRWALSASQVPGPGGSPLATATSLLGPLKQLLPSTLNKRDTPAAGQPAGCAASRWRRSAGPPAPKPRPRCVPAGSDFFFKELATLGAEPTLVPGCILPPPPRQGETQQGPSKKAPPANKRNDSWLPMKNPSGAPQGCTLFLVQRTWQNFHLMRGFTLHNYILICTVHWFWENDKSEKG